MILDILLIITLVLAVIKGFRRGFILGIFSLLAIIIGLAAAIKLSAVVASHISGSVNVSNRWLPVISFAIVFIGVVLLVRLGAILIQKSMEVAMMGWLNRLAGILLYVVIYVIVYSIFLFYAEQIKLIKPETIQASVTYHYVQPWGPAAINALGWLLPFFRNMFTELQSFFGGIAQDIPQKG